MKQLSRHLTFANAISCIALFVALSGGAYAAKTALGNKAVKTKNLANGSVNTLKLRSGAVTTLKLRNGAVTGPKIAPGAVGATQIANGAVRSAALGGGVVTTGKLKDGAVSSEKLANGAVTNSKLGADALTTGKLQDGAVTAAKLSASLYAQLLKNVSYVTATSPPNTEDKLKSITAQCPTGKQVTGGGARVTGTDVTIVAMIESTPFLNPESKRTGWTASADSIGGADPKPWGVEAIAICAEF